jgi:hypothetical protein
MMRPFAMRGIAPMRERGFYARVLALFATAG